MHFKQFETNMGRHSSYTTLICIEAREKQKNRRRSEDKKKTVKDEEMCVFFT